MCERKQFTCKVIPGSASRGVVTWVGKGRKSVKTMLPTVCGCGQLGLNPLGALWETVENGSKLSPPSGKGAGLFIYQFSSVIG